MEKNHKSLASQNFSCFGLLYLIFQFLFIHISAQHFTCTPGYYNGVLSTGVGISNGVQILTPIGNPDQFWQCSTISAAGPNAQVISANGNCGQSPSNGTGNWIGPSSAAALCPGQPPSYWACMAANNTIIDFWFIRNFTLPVNSVFVIDWSVFASGWVDEIWVNNDLAYKTCATYSNHPSHSANGMHFKWCKFNNTLNNTQNTIRIKVSNTNYTPHCAYTGLLVQSWLPNPNSCFSLTGPTATCNGDQATWSMPVSSLVTQSPTIFSYGWYKPQPWASLTPTNLINYSCITQQVSGLVTGAVTSTQTINCGGTTIKNISCEGAGQVFVNVGQGPLIIGSNTTICEGQCITFSTNPQVTFTCASSTQTLVNGPITVCPNVTTTYTLSAQGTGTNANCFSKKIVKITVKPKPTITLNTPNPVCQGNPIALFCTGNVISYTWIPGSLPHAPIVQYTPTTSGNQCVAVTGTNGCMSFTCVPVVVNPTPAILAFATPSVVCPGGVSYLYATGGNSYYWNAPINSSLNPLWVAPAVSTTYNVTGWGTNGCSRTETVAVLTLQAPTVTCQPPQICTGIQNTLTAFGASSYDWWVGAAPNTTFYPNTQSIFLTLTASTPYTVCGYGPNSCQACTSGVLNPGNPIPLSTTNVTLCTNSGLCTNISVASSFTAPINYSWAPAGILGSTINVCPAANTIYTVYANPSGTLGCPNSATLSVTLNSLCCPQATNGMVALNPAAGLGNLYANNSYVLSGPITLTASSTFSNAEVLMMPNAQITVPSGFQLNMEKAHMYACGNNMWNGIVVQDGGRIITSNSNLYTSMIEDAEIGIDLSGISVSNSSPLPPIEIQRVIFNRNYIGIRVANSDPGLDSLALGISGCVFTSRTLTFTSLPGLNWPSAEMTCGLPGVTALRCPTGPTTGLNSPYLALASFPAFQIASLKLPHNSEPGRAGIQIAKIGNPNGILSTPGVQIGITYPGIVAGDFNLFDGLGIGIDVLDAGLTTMNNVFQNMQNYLAAPNFTSFTGGQGIRHIVYNTTLMNARMYLTHTNTDDGNRFWNCPTAIQVNNVMDCWIRQGIFRSNHSVSTAQWPNAIPGDTGISINTNRFAFTVRESQFNNITHAVVFSTPTAACNYDIGAGIQPGICSREIVVERNYFGAQVTSTTPYSQGMANTSEYMYQAIKLQTPPSVNLNNWNYHPNSSPSFIISNKIDRSFRGVLVDGMMDNPIYVDANMMNIEDDYTFGPNSSTPNEGYGIEIRNNLDNMTIRSNTLTTANPWHNPLPSTPTIALVYCHLNYGSNASPRIECNSTQGSWYGFQFDDYNRSTVWEGNEMCTHWSGMALTNNGIIGTQGTPTQASGNVWKIAPGCQQIPAASNAYHTYCENSDPLNSFLYVTSTLDREPTFNNAAGFPGVWYTSGVSYDASVQQNRLSDCVGTFAYLPPPNWKITEVNNSTYLQSVNSNFLARIIPNPNMGIFELKFPTKIERAEIRMFDLCGRIQLETEFLNTDNTKIDISDLPNSIYLIEVTTNEHTFRAKVVKTY